jgi:MFS family permease
VEIARFSSVVLYSPTVNRQAPRAPIIMRQRSTIMHSLPIQRLGALWRRLSLSIQSPTERNIVCLYIEVVFAGVLAAAGSFNGAYILRLGGSNALVGLLSSLPALVAVFFYLPSARIWERQRRAERWIVGSLALARSGYIAIMLLPFILKSRLPEVTVGILVAVTVPSVFFTTGWSPMLSDVIPARSRATVLAWRSILSSATIAGLTYLMGRLLDRGQFPGNYQWMYAIGVLGGALSIYFISRIRMTHVDTGDEGAAQAPPLGETPTSWRDSLRAAARENSGFKRIIINTFVFDLGNWMIAPLYIILFVRELGASDSWVGLHMTLAHVGVVVGYWVWRHVIHRIGENKGLLLALPLACTYPFMVALVPNLSFILFAGFMINVLNPGVGLSHGIIFLNLLPPKRKYGATALYSMVMNIGAFVAPLLGVAIAERIGILPTLLIGGALRILGAGLFYLFPLAGGRPRFDRPRGIALPRLFGG